MSTWVDSPNIVQRGVRRLIGTRSMAWVLARTMHHIDGTALRASGGRFTAGSLFTGLPLITLTTTGAKSGRPRSVTLVGVPDAERLILVASNWGQAKHPAWYYNVRAHPEVTVTVRGESRAYRARELAGVEREAAWARAVGVYPGYGGYAERAGREIPVVILEGREE
jgi:deazaflavin-dependent oxidoreductase (nitroreductase family)